MSPHIIDYRKAETFDDVADYLGLRPEVLERAIAAGRAPDAKPVLYVRHRIPKRRPGEVRVVWDVINPQIRDTHRAFSWRFEDFARDVLSNFPHRTAYGYVRKRGIRDNAAQHIGARRLLRCDLKDFFSTITLERLLGRFLEIGIQHAAARVLAEFATIEGKLALGLNASPVLANFVCVSLDNKLESLASKCNCRYTRYADDIAISGDDIPSKPALVEIIEGEGFRLSQGKTRVSKFGQAHFVTGLSISDPQAPRVPRTFKRRLRQELYYCTKFGIRGHLTRADADRSYQKGVNRLDGSVRFLKYIEPTIGKRLRATWVAAMAAESASVSYRPVFDRANTKATFLLDETEFHLDGKHHLAVGCVTTEQTDVVRQHVVQTLRQHLIDPFSAGRKDSLTKRGLHFAEAPEDLRSQYIVFLRYLPFRAYIAFGQLHERTTYEDLYTRLLEALLVQRFKSHDRGVVEIRAEENGQVSSASLNRVITGLYENLERRNERRPVVRPVCFVLSKAVEPSFSLVDALLWIFGRTFGAKEGANDLDYLRFERLRDKYRHIINVDTSEMFSRRHPIEIRRRRGVEREALP